ncbi:MAG: PAS domain S-box protein [Planctomycetes bacterium]|nr:PAS domain S-box protein [Planctomycetota bacterium]MCB9935875.1 PAS domain S-box protein [Planctomycetota bacterium]
MSHGGLKKPVRAGKGALSVPHCTRTGRNESRPFLMGLASQEDSLQSASPGISGGIWIATVVAIAAAFTLDVVTPLRLAGGEPYVLVVLIGLWTPSRKFLWGLAGTCLAVTILGTFFFDPDLGESIFLTHRVTTVAAIIICAALVHYQLSLRDKVMEARRRSRDYLDVADVLFVGLDTNGNITLLNRRGCELLGYKEPEVLGKNWFSTFVPQDVVEELRVVHANNVTGTADGPTSHENPVRAKDGTLRQIRWVNLTLRDSNGRVTGTLSSGEDVTDLKRTEQQLVASEADLVRARNELFATEQLMAAVVETAVEGIITIDPQGLIQTANAAACRIFGYKREEMVGNNVSMLMPSPERDEHDGYLRKYMETGVAGIIGQGRELVALRKSGERFPIHLAVSDVRDHTVRLFTGVVRDLTVEKRMQKKLQEQEALAAIGQMAAVVAHEVKNPLAGIAGVIQVLRGRYAKDSGEHQIMGEVLTRIDALVETLQDLLLYARPRDLKLADVPLNELLAETARLLAADPRSHDVKVEMPATECRLKVDVDYLREALLNIYLNAAQAMQGKGEIRTELHNDEELCILRIADTGPGIPPEVRHRVFEPFFTTKGRGTGLGLALVKRVIERHGGEVAIDCPPEGGTVVTLTLPHLQGSTTT